MENQIKKVHLDYVDCAKGLLIFLVVIGHLFDADMPIKNFIYGFHMPAFFRFMD